VTGPANVAELLEKSPAYQHLDPRTRQSLRDDLARVAGFLSAQPLAGQLAPGPVFQPTIPGSQGPMGGPAPAPAPPPGQTPASRPQRSTTERVGDVARATLNAIDFPRFVAQLIQGTFQAIVDASIQQMEAYAELLRNVTRTIDSFMQENVSPDMARDYLADNYGSVFTRDLAGTTPRLTVQPTGRREEALPSFFQDLGFGSVEDIDDQSIEEVIVPATRRDMAQKRQQLLATMVLMGLNRIVVDDGEIKAKLQFHIDASEEAQLRFDQTKTTIGNLSGTAGRSPFTANGIMVNTTSLNAQSDINVRTDLTGEVMVRFRSETFPLERFADSVAIQLINSNASVPQQNPAPNTAPPVTNAPQNPPAQNPVPPPPATQALGNRRGAADPWAPRKSS
jgi:hypothetical protein